MTIIDILRNNLSQEQFNAATDQANEVLCLACAGSGKSRTLAYRIARLIAEGNEPSSIVAFTFTEKAADSIKRRVASALEKAGLPVAMVGAMYIGTIHSYCQNLLGESDARYRQFDVLDDNRLKLFLLSRFYDLGLPGIKNERGARFFETISEVSNAWKLANDEMLSFQDIAGYDQRLGSILQEIYNRLINDQFLDFSLMIRLVVEALQNNDPSINRALQGVNHLMVDEYQDVNPAQEYLIRGLHERVKTLFVVGDDDQSIYGWRGADVRNIINFNQRYPNCSEHTLSTNFRSTQAIVETSGQFISVELATQRIGKNPTHHSNGNIRQFGNLWFASRQEEATWVAARINELLGTRYEEDDGTVRGLTKADFAILFRSVTGGTRGGNAPYHFDFTAALDELEIGYTIEAEGSIFERLYARVLRDAMGLLRAPGINRRTAQAFFSSNVLPLFPHADFEAFAELLYEWNRKIHNPQGGARRKVYPQNLVQELLHAFRIHRMDLDDAILRDLGVFSGIILDIEKVYVSIDSTGRYQAILNFLDNVAESGYDASSVELLARPDAVTISTVHKMKGLEFPVVFIVDVINRRFPLNNRRYNGWLPAQIISPVTARGLYETNHQGEARLFYTALTRAERFLYVTGSEYHPRLKKPAQPSRFKLRLSHNEITDNPTELPQNISTVPQSRRVDDNSMPTSFTEIKDYLDCPMKYKYRKIFGFSPAVPELFGYGQTTHTAINKIHQEFLQNPPSREEAEDVLEDVFHLKHVFPSSDSSRPGPFERARDRAKEIIGNYVQDYSDDFLRSRQLEYRFEIKADPALITGSIDLLLREDTAGNIVEAKVVDFKTMDRPDEDDLHFWINLSLQVQLYANAASVVLGENAKTGAVHLLKAENNSELPNRIEVPINDASLKAAIENITWAVQRILQRDFPMRPSANKCEACDFRLICSKRFEDFVSDSIPPEIHIPGEQGEITVHVGAISNVES